MAGRNLQGGKRMEEQEKNQGGQEGAILVDMPLLQHTLSRMKKEKENFQEDRSCQSEHVNIPMLQWILQPVTTMDKIFRIY